MAVVGRLALHRPKPVLKTWGEVVVNISPGNITSPTYWGFLIWHSQYLPLMPLPSLHILPSAQGEEVGSTEICDVDDEQDNAHLKGKCTRR